MNEKEIGDIYLGDGVYGSFDGYHIWLDLRAQDPAIRIALEPTVLANLNQYAEAIRRHYQQVEEYPVTDP